MFEWWWEFLYSISHAINQCIDAMFRLFMFFAGAADADINAELTGSASSNPLKAIFSTNTVAIWFAGILGIAVLVFLISFIIAMVRTEYVSKDNHEGKMKVFKASIKGTMIVVLMPIIFGIGVRAVTILLSGISAAMSTDGNNSFAQELMNICMPDQSQQYPWDSSYSQLVTWLGDNGSMHDYNYFIAYIGGIIMLFILGLSVLTLIERIIDLVFLYIISPVIVAVSPLDDGNRLGIWKDLTIAKFTSIAGMIICFYIYFLFMSIINSLLIGSSFLIRFAKLICAIGGALAARKGGLLVSNLVGHNTALIEGQQAGLAAQAVGTGFRAGLGVIGALGHGAVSLLGSAAHRIGGAIGGVGSAAANTTTGVVGAAGSAAANAATGVAAATMGAAATTFNAISQGYNQTQAASAAPISTANNTTVSENAAAPVVNTGAPSPQSVASSGQRMAQPPAQPAEGVVPDGGTQPLEAPAVVPPIAGEIQSVISNASGFNKPNGGNSENK